MAEARQYPKSALRKLELSTIQPCGSCGVENKVNEEVLIDDSNGKVYHVGHEPGAKTEVKVHELNIDDGLPVKSE
jgi:hypothetical protein